MSKGQREMTHEELKYAYMKKVQRVQELEDELIEQKECYEELQNNHIRVCNQNKRYRALLALLGRVSQAEDLEDVWDIEDDYRALEESE